MNVQNHLATPNHDYHDWEITVMFYAILHLVDAYCVRNGLPVPKNHRQRNRIVRKRLGRIYPKYKALLNLSKQARYSKGRGMSSSGLDRAKSLHRKLKASLSRN